jgi:hypothetical protein
MLKHTYQMLGQNGFLTGDEAALNSRSSLGQFLARRKIDSLKKLSRQSIELSRRLYVKYRVRYLLAFARRFASEAIVSFVIFVLAVEYFLHASHLEFLTWGVAILAAAYMGEKIVSAQLRKRRVESHKEAVLQSMARLYGDYLLFLRSRALASIGIPETKDTKPVEPGAPEAV